LLVAACSCSAYADPGALNRAEWIKFVAVFFNKEVEANRIFNKVNTDYQALNTSARAAAAAATPPAANRVAWISKFSDSLTMSYAVYKQELVTVSISPVLLLQSTLCSWAVPALILLSVPLLGFPVAPCSCISDVQASL
jgi:hypothetical protein